MGESLKPDVRPTIDSNTRSRYLLQEEEFLYLTISTLNNNQQV